MESNSKLEVLGNSAVQDHISMHQDIINRMAGNSANSKNWTITLVAAMLVLLVDKNMQIPNAWICLIPIGLFYLLDCYYLGLERMCIASQNEFLKKVKNGNDYIDSLYKVEDLKDNYKQLCNTIKAMKSFSTTPFYLIVAIVVLYFGGIIKFQPCIY
ncbi:hypothetical protein [Hoylesella nanceiensis]|uniref:hypothetical protein n=1 Tax=Hoylesella nanceiensis TaxID=425941 RepID=UPI0028EE0F31|nr:hypothetical protein [Hoylesella nanceiensis]